MRLWSKDWGTFCIYPSLQSLVRRVCRDVLLGYLRLFTRCIQSSSIRYLCRNTTQTHRHTHTNIAIFWAPPPLPYSGRLVRVVGSITGSWLPLQPIPILIVYRTAHCKSTPTHTLHRYRSVQTRQVHINSHAYTCIHHRIQPVVGDMTISGWKPTTSLIHPHPPPTP